MLISLPGKSTTSNPRARCHRTADKTILYRVWAPGAVLLALLAAPVTSRAQQDVPETPTSPKKANPKNDKGPRALGLVQLSSNGKATLVPITIRIDGRFYDAASYKGNPVPMALEPGTVYEAERTGASVGLFTVNAALHSNAINAVTPWLGAGMWLPAGAEAPKGAMQAENVPRGIETTDQPPRLSKNDKAAAAAPPAAAPAPSTAPPPPPSKPAPDSKPSPPSQPAQNSATPPSDQTNSGAGETNRPRLRRGKPTQPLPSDDDVPGYSKPGSAPTATRSPAGTSATPAASPSAAGPIQIYPAISDAGGPDPRSYKFEWLKGEEGERRKQMLDFAQEQLHLYLNQQAKGLIAQTTTSQGSIAQKSKTTAPTSKNPTTARKRPSKATEAPLENVQFRTFDLWANNQPVLVLSAEAHIPSTPSAGPTAGNYTITLVARTDIYNNLHKLYSGVTDKYHLDVTPQLDLIDAVDADGDGRGELLFRETTDAGSGYIIYRATADKLWKLFDTLNPE